jgi:hypothetical protein
MSRYTSARSWHCPLCGAGIGLVPAIRRAHIRNCRLPPALPEEISGFRGDLGQWAVSSYCARTGLSAALAIAALSRARLDVADAR